MLNDVWSSEDGIHWQEMTTHAPWTPRGGEHSVVFQNKLWIYGGKSGTEEYFKGDVWQMSQR